MVLEGMELVQLDIDDLFLPTAGRFFGRLLRLRLFRGRRLHSGRTLVSLLFRSGSLRGLFLAPGGLGRRFLPDGSFLLVRRLFCRSGLFLVRRSFRLCLLRRAALALRRLRCFVRLLFHSLVRLFGLLCLIRWCGCLLRRFFFFRRFLLGHDFRKVVDGDIRAFLCACLLGSGSLLILRRGGFVCGLLRGLLFRCGRFGFHRFLDGSLFRGLARPGVRRCRLRGFCGFIIWHTRLPPDFGHEKRGLTFHQAPVGWFLLSCQATKIPPVVSFGRYLCVRLAVHC